MDRIAELIKANDKISLERFIKAHTNLSSDADRRVWNFEMNKIIFSNIFTLEELETLLIVNSPYLYHVKLQLARVYAMKEEYDKALILMDELDTDANGRYGHKYVLGIKLEIQKKANRPIEQQEDTIRRMAMISG